MAKRPGESRLIHCRIGSSEKPVQPGHRIPDIHCRIGSSESLGGEDVKDTAIHCRIGSSEIDVVPAVGELGDSLPDRQLRKIENDPETGEPYSLPDRQLRNSPAECHGRRDAFTAG